MTVACILVDIQNDFCPGGSLGTAKGDTVAEGVRKLLEEHGDDYDFVLATQDWHIDPGTHFSENPDFVDTWPVHCVADTDGAQLRAPLASISIDKYFRKGHYTAAYSGFEGVTDGDVLLGDWLREHGVTTVDVCGIATDHCVRATVLDARKEGFDVRVLADLCSPVDEERGQAALREMEEAGATFVAK